MASNKKVKKTMRASAKSKMLLTELQIQVLRDCHQKIIKDGLSQMGIPQIMHKPYLDTASQTFETFIKNTQDELLELAEKADIRQDILNG